MKFTKSIFSKVLKLTCLMVTLGLAFIFCTSTSTSVSIKASNSNSLEISKSFITKKSNSLKTFNSKFKSTKGTYFGDYMEKVCRNWKLVGTNYSQLEIECQNGYNKWFYGIYDLDNCLESKYNGEFGDQLYSKLPFKRKCKGCSFRMTNELYLQCDCWKKGYKRYQISRILVKYGKVQCGEPLIFHEIKNDPKDPKNKKNTAIHPGPVKPKNFASSEKLISEFCSEIKLAKNDHILSARCGYKSPEEIDKNLQFLSEINLGECIGTDSKGILKEKFRGNYYKKCKDCKLTGTKLSCDCSFSKYKSDKGKFVNSSIDLNQIIATDQGVLTRCGPLALRKEELANIGISKKDLEPKKSPIYFYNFSKNKDKEYKITETCMNFKLSDGDIHYKRQKKYEGHAAEFTQICKYLDASYPFYVNWVERSYDLGECVGKTSEGKLIEKKRGYFYYGCRNCRLFGLILNCDCEKDQKNNFNLINTSLDLEKFMRVDNFGRLKCAKEQRLYDNQKWRTSEFPKYKSPEDEKKDKNKIAKKENSATEKSGKNKKKTISNSCRYFKLHKPHCKSCTSYEYFTSECKNNSNNFTKSTVNLGECIAIDDDGKLVNKDKGEFYKNCKDCKIFGTFLMCNCTQDEKTYEYSMIDLSKIIQIGADGNLKGCGPINPIDKNGNNNNGNNNNGNNGNNGGGISPANMKELKDDLKGMIKDEMKKICRCVRKKSTDLLKSNQQERDTKTGR